MNKSTFPIYILVALFFSYSCKQKNKNFNPAQSINDLNLKRGELISCGPSGKEFGTVNFSNSCIPATQKHFDLGIAMLHSFEYDEAEKAFAKVLDIDSNCAMAYWGVAMSNFHQVWPSPPSPEELEKGKKAVDKARRMVMGSDIGKDYINTIGAFYNDYSNYSQRQRILNYAKAMEEMYGKYPGDKEVAVFYALSLVSAADASDKTFSRQKKAGEILNGLYPGQPMHPGIVHYIIHAFDAPELASMALDAARKYASIAPASAHAQHMPSHIFTRLGLWDEAIRSNTQAAASAKCYAESVGIKGHWDEELHAIDYLIYASLQEGKNIQAKQQLDYLMSFTQVHPVNFKVLYAFAASPSRYYLENHMWREAASMKFQPGFPWEKYPWQKAIVHFTRSLGSARSNNLDAARNEWKNLQPCFESLKSKKDDYQANQVAIQIKIAEAWISYAEGKHRQALEQMKTAVTMEDATEKSPVTPGEVLPARQLLADMLLKLNMPAEALLAYEADLKKHPNRFNSIVGAATASDKIKNAVKAKQYYKQLLIVAHESTREEVGLAKAYLANAK